MQNLGRGVQSIEVSGKILAVLSSRATSMMLKDISVESGLTPGQAHAYLVSLRRLGLVEKDAGGTQYKLGPFALQIGLTRLRNSDPFEQVWETLPELTAKMNLSMTMSIWSQNGPVIIRYNEAPYQIYANVRPGSHYSLLDTATGKVFAAYLKPKLFLPLLNMEISERFDRGQRAAQTNLYLEKIAAVREAGYAIAVGEPIPGIDAISVPIFEFSGNLIAAITAIGPEGSIDLRENGITKFEMLRYAQVISEKLGGFMVQTGSDG